MVKIRKLKSKLNKKTDQELFYIYCGYKKQLPKNVRYLAGRLLEERSFQFNDISTYKKNWAQKKWKQNNSPISDYFSHFINQHKTLSVIISMAGLILLFFTFFQVSPQLRWAINFNEMMLFAINILSFASLFIIFGFIGYLSRNIHKIKQEKRMMELSH